ncbi:hypothetical protein [Hymenobacter antarcticus]|uniref:Uncharacterized protein n=1 Tax=Hymenobacter antarcticus TaxID=486270 RepID=A0ABP7Q441_9BACT
MSLTTSAGASNEVSNALPASTKAAQSKSRDFMVGDGGCTAARAGTGKGSASAGAGP